MRPEQWLIENGEICKVSGIADSIKKPAPFKTLEVKGESLTTPTGNGGVTVETAGELALAGSKNTRHGDVWTGGIFGLGARSKMRATPPTNEIRDNTWTSFRLQVSADTITTWLNAKPVSSMSVPPHSGTAHKISLQGSPQCEVAYRNLMIRELKE